MSALKAQCSPWPLSLPNLGFPEEQGYKATVHTWPSILSTPLSVRKAGKSSGWCWIFWFFSPRPLPCLTYSGYTVHCSHLGQTLRPAQGLYVRELPSVRTRSSALPSWEKVCPPTCRQCCVSPCGHQRAEPARPHSLRRGGRPAQPARSQKGGSCRNTCAWVFFLYTSRALFQEAVFVHIPYKNFRGETAVLETSPFHTPTQKYKNTTRLVRRDVHLSPKSPYFLPSSLCHTHKQPHEHSVGQSECTLPLSSHSVWARPLIKWSQFPQLQNGESFFPPGDNLWMLLTMARAS